MIYDSGTLARFKAGVDQREPDECWPWRRSTTSNGYGQLSRTRMPGVKHKVLAAHRVAYEVWVGPIPDGYDVDHTCHNKVATCHGPCRHRRCCNPNHLEAVPPSTNRGRMPESARAALGAIQRAKTHCKHGHEFTPENTYLVPLSTGATGRACRECKRLHALRRRARHRGDPNWSTAL